MDIVDSIERYLSGATVNKGVRKLKESNVICPICKTDADTRVLMTEVVPNGRKRRRRCPECGHTFNTLETMRGLRRVREVVVAEGSE